MEKLCCFCDIGSSILRYQMIKNLEVVGAFSAKKIFPEKIIFDDLPPPPFRSVYHFRGPKNFRTYQNFSRHNTNFTDQIFLVNFFYKKTISRFSLTFCGILFFVCRQIPSFADNLFSGGCHTPHTPPFATALAPAANICKMCLHTIRIGPT